MINYTIATNGKTNSFKNPSPKRSRFNILKYLSLFAMVLMLGVNGVSGQTTIYSTNFGTTAVTSSSTFVAGWTSSNYQTGGTAPTNMSISTSSSSSTYSTPITASGGANLADGSSSQSSGTATATLAGQVNTTGYTTIEIAFGYRASSSLYTATVTLDWSPDGNTWNSISLGTLTRDGAWRAINGSNWLSLPSGAENQSNLRFRFTFVRANNSGNFRIDDFTVRGTAPVTDYFWNGGNLTNNTNNTWDNNTTRNWGITNLATFPANTAPGVVWPASGAFNANFNNVDAATTVSLPAALSVMPNNTIIGTSGYTFAPAVTQTFSSPITLTNSLTIEPAVSTVFTMSGIASSTGGLIHNGSGATTISAANTFTTAGFTLTNGIVVVGNANALGAASSPLALNGGTISSTGSNFTLANTAITVGGNFQLGEIAGNVSTAGVGNLTFGGTVNLGSSARTITLGNAGSHVFSGVISNTSGGLTFTANNNGTGRFDITNAANTFTGPININGNGTGVAEVRFTSDGSLGNTSNTININGGRLATLSAATYTLTSTRGIQVGNTTGTSISTPGAGVLTYDGVISDLSGSTPGAWAKQGGGTLSLGGVSTYTGATAINNGTLRLTTGNDRLPTGTVLTLGQASSANLGTFDLNGRNQTVASLNSTTGINTTASNNTITSSVAAILTVSGSSNSSYGDGTNTNSGVITGSISLVKSGSGSLTLADANTYTGTTTLSAGTLFVNGSLASGSAVSVGASGTLAGSGTAAGTVSLTGTVSPGGTATTTANLSTGAFTFNANSTYKFEMNNATGSAGNVNGWDKITSSGTITCSASPITIDITSVSIANFSNSSSTSWVIASGSSISGFNAGNFTLSTTNFLPSLAGGFFSISATGTDISLVFNSATPSVITSGTIPNFGAVTVNTTSPSSSFPSYNVSGAFLTNDITITPPVGVEVSTSSTFASNIGTNSSPITLTQSGGNVSSTPIYVRFAPTTASGSFSANITNVSSPAPTQNVAITGNAVDLAPTTQTTSISFSSITSTTMTVNLNTTGNGAKRILVAKAGSAVNSNPVDGTTYTANLAFGSGTQIGTGNYVIVASNASSANITGLSSATTYHFALYEYNDNAGTSGAENYNTTAPTTNSQATTAASILWSSAGGSAWLTGSNWTGGSVPSGGDIAQFSANPTGTTVGINMGNPTNNGTNNQRVGAIEVTSARTSAVLNVGNSSGSTSGTLTLSGAMVNSISDVIIRNNSSQLLTIQANQNLAMVLALALGNSSDNKISIDGTGNIVISNIVSSASGTTPLTIRGSGSGRLELTNTANTYTGTISISGAEARFAGPNSFGNVNNTLVIDGGRMATVSATTYELASTHTIQVGATANTSISVVTSGTLTYNGVIADKYGSTGAWAKQGAGILSLGGVSTYTGATDINNGTIQLTTGNDRLPTGTVLSLGQASSENLGTFDLNGRNQTIGGLNSTSGTNATSSNNTITSATAATLAVNGAGSYGDGTDANSGIIAGAISLVKSGSGTLTLGDANTYTGTTTVSGGTLQLAGGNVGSVGAITSSPIGTSTLNLNGGTLSSNSTTARTVLNTTSIGGNITLGDATNTGALTFDAATTISGATRALTTASAVTFAGAIGDGGNAYGITKAGAGTLTLSGANSYTGATTLSAGTLQLAGGNVGSVGSITSSPIGRSTINLNGGTLSSNSTIARTVLNATSLGGDITLGDATNTGALTFDAAISISGATRTLTTASAVTFAGAIGDGGNAYGITKAGTGTLTLSGATTYTGTTTISAGTINVTGITGITSTSFTSSAQSVTFSSTTPTNGTYQIFNGPVSVTTQSFSSNAGAGKSVTFNYSTGVAVVADVATITSFSPTSGGAGTSIVITGTYLTGTSSVSFNGVSASSFTVDSDSQITAIVPAGLGAGGLVSIVKNSLTVNSATNFVVNYYLASGGSITNFADFGQDASGTDGNTPTAINSNNYSNFYIVNNTSVTQGANITLGTGSKIIVGDGTNATALIIPATRTSSGTIDVNDGGTLTVNNTSVLHTLGTLGTTSSTVIYSANGNQTVAAKPYANLTISGSGVKTIGVGTSSVAGTLSLNAGTLDISTNTLVLNGLVSQSSGIIDADAGTLSFGNSADMSLLSTLFSGDIYNLSKSSGSGVLTVNDNLNITNNLSTSASTGALVLASTKQLTIDGIITNNGTFTIENGATLKQTGTGANANTGSGTYNVKQAITGSGGATPNGRFWYLGGAISDASSTALLSSAGNQLWQWNEASFGYTAVTSGQPLTQGKSYVLRSGQSTETINFSGASLSNGTVNVTGLTRSGTTQTYRGCHLISNPYPSYLDWNSITKTNIGTTMYIRTAIGTTLDVMETFNSSGSIATTISSVPLTQYIAPMQGFWVKVTTDGQTGSLTMNNTMRSHQSSGSGLRSTAQDFPAFLRFNMLDGQNKDQVILLMSPDAAMSLDAFDSEKMSASGYAQFYSTVNATKLVINGMKNVKAKTSVPLTLVMPTSKSYTFQAEEFNIEDGLILLEDKQEGVIQDLTINPTYSFFGNAGTNATRFVVHFQLASAPVLVGGPQELESLGSDELTTDNIQIVSNNQGTVIIRLDEGFKPEGSIRIFDASGRLVEQTDFNDQETTIHLNEQAGMYFVEVSAGKLMVKKKIVIN